MARAKRKTKRRLLTGVPAAPGSLRALGTEYLEWAKVKHFSSATVATYEAALRRFAEWCDARGLARAAEVTRPLLERYQRHLFYYRKANGRPLTATSQLMALSPLRGFFRWAVRHGDLLSNPASELDLPRKPHVVPHTVLTPAQAEEVLALPDVSTPLGLRDRALLETLYSTGLRRKEAAQLLLHSLNFEAGTVLVRQGKGAKDRLVPIGERALAWASKYLEEARPRLWCSRDEGQLFLSATGEPFSPDELTHLVKRYLKVVVPAGSCHVFRHSMATAMLEAGADIRFIQAILGHARLDTTQVYTQVAISKLKAVHAATHPAAKLQHQRVEPAAPDSALLEALAAEAEEEAVELE